MTLTHTVRDFSVKETAAEMRKALKQAFPAVKFSVTMARGTAYGWLDVSWTDGPRAGQVQPIIRAFESRRFDGMTDGYNRVEPTLYAEPDGSLYEPRYSCCGANWHRDFSPEVDAWSLATAVRGSYWWPEGSEPWHDHYRAARNLLHGLDLTNGLPICETHGTPDAHAARAAFVERWQS